MLTVKQNLNYGYSTSKKQTHNICLRLLNLSRILLPIGMFWFAATSSIVAFFTTVSTLHIVSFATYFNALIWFLLIRLFFSLFFGPPTLFPRLRWIYGIHITVSRPVIWSRHRINPTSIGMSECIHKVPFTDIYLGFMMI